MTGNLCHHNRRRLTRPFWDSCSLAIALPAQIATIKSAAQPAYAFVLHAKLFDIIICMKVLVLGGTGLFGPFVVRQVVALGHDVTIFHTGEHEADLPPQVRHIHSPLGRRPMYNLPPELRSLTPDVVLHML